MTHRSTHPRKYERRTAAEDIPDRNQRTGSRPKATAFENVADFDSVPPPAGDGGDVHAAATTIGQVSDALLEGMREGGFSTDEASTRPRMVQVLGDDAVVVVSEPPPPVRPSPPPSPVAKTKTTPPAPDPLAASLTTATIRTKRASPPPPAPRLVHPAFVVPDEEPERAWMVFFLAGLMTLVAIALAFVVPRYL